MGIVADLEARLEPWLVRCRFPIASATVTCAVSGGADSMALLMLARAAGLDVTAVHVVHGLREGSSAEAEVVRAAAERFGARFEARTVSVPPGADLEARARRARYEVLPAEVLTGHTADDQAETVLMFLMRGTGPEGLAGIDPRRRPLLALRRSDTEAVCRELGLAYIDDPSNADPAFTRNRVRHELLPLMAEISRRDVVDLIARTAGLQAEVMSVLEVLAEQIDATDARAVAAAEPALARIALRQSWRTETGADYAPDAATIERMLTVAHGDAVSADLIGGWRIERSSQRLRITGPAV